MRHPPDGPERRPAGRGRPHDHGRTACVRPAHGVSWGRQPTGGVPGHTGRPKVRHFSCRQALEAPVSVGSTQDDISVFSQVRARFRRSARWWRRSPRQDVLRRVNVPVVPGAAGRARPVPRLQAEFGEQMPARRARFGRRYQRPVTISCRPALAVLYASIWRKVPHPQSEMALASDRLRTMLCTARSSTTITSWPRTRAVVVRCRKSVRDARTFRCARATFALALARFAEPRWARASRR